jgi:hypothetical protein
MSLTEMKKEYANLQAQIGELNMQMQKKSKDLMKAVLADFFEKYDSIVKNIYWTQYTPFFNDGESCEFSVHDVWITFRKQNDSDEAEDYSDEGSTVYGEDDIKELKARIAKWEEFNRDPKAAANRYREYHIKQYNNDPFGRKSWDRNKTTEQKIAEWKPDHISLETLQAELALAEKIVADYPDLKKDYDEVANMIELDLDVDLMKAMFGDHVKVICTKNGIETEEYEHD